MKEVFFSGYITGNEVTHHCTQDGKAHFLNLSIAFYNGKDKQGNEKTGYLDISIVINQESRVDSILPILVKGNYIHGRGKSTTKIIHIVNKKTNKTEPTINEQVECRVEAVQIVARNVSQPAAEPTQEQCLQYMIDSTYKAMRSGQLIEELLSDLMCIKHGAENVEAIEKQDEYTFNILAAIELYSEPEENMFSKALKKRRKSEQPNDTAGEQQNDTAGEQPNDTAGEQANDPLPF